MSHFLVVKAVVWFFKELNNKRIKYTVLRKIERIPGDIGNDIDVLIRESEKAAVLKIIRDCAEKFGFKIYERKNVAGLYTILYIFFEETLVFFRLDFTNPIKNSDALLDARLQNEDGVYYLPSETYKKSPNLNLKRFFTFPKRFLFPPGKFVVIIGPDGVGKSTTADLVAQLLKAFHIPVTHMHLGFRPRILPRKKRLLLQEKKRDASKKDVPSTTPGILRFLYYSLDYILGYWFRIRQLLVKGRTVIGERYYYNYLVDPRPQKEMKFPSWLPRLVYKLFIPKPDMFILLSHDSEEIYKRRQEHSVEEIKRQLVEYRREGKKIQHFMEIRTDKPAREVAIEIVDKLTADI